MKIAIVGKWWSGKSSVSRLLTKYISQNKNVIAIDSDHNMDLTNLLWYDFKTYVSPNFKDSLNDMMYHLDYEEFKAKKMINDNIGHHKFFINNMDNYSKKILIDIGDNIYLGIVWLGSDDVMDDNRCAHGMSNPLKVYLTLLDEWNSDVVVDWVAGVDMINFGLYHACDYLVVVVEPSRNSIRVANQISKLCDRSQVNYWVVINKYVQNEYFKEIDNIFGDKVIWKIWYDDWLFKYNYDIIGQSIKNDIGHIYKIIQNNRWSSLVDRMMMLEKFKNKMK